MLRLKGPVLHFIDTTGPGGAETVFLQVAQGLRERGWATRTVLVGPGWVLDRVRELDLPVDVLPTSGRFDLSYLQALRDVVCRHEARLIHAHLFSPAVYASLVGAWTDVPVVATFHGASDTERGGWGRALRYRLIDRGASVVCVSEMLRDELRALPEVHAKDVRVIHNGVDVARFSSADGAAVRAEHGIGDDTVLVGALGNVRPAKDFPNLIEAARLLAPDHRLAFAIVGETTEPLFGEVRELRDRYGLQDRLEFWGFRDDVPAVMDAFDVLAISSKSEGFSLAAIQAMAAGTPVVATRSGGPDKILTDGVDGLLVPVGSPEALATGIRRVVDEEGLRSRVIACAKLTVTQRFSLRAMLDGYERVYAELV